jgi:hypothetical protein
MQMQDMKLNATNGEHLSVLRGAGGKGVSSRLFVPFKRVFTRFKLWKHEMASKLLFNAYFSTKRDT